MQCELGDSWKVIFDHVTSRKAPKQLECVKHEKPAMKVEGHDLKKALKTQERFECQHCNEKLLIRTYRRHMEPCKVYSKFMKMNNIGYECTVCSIKRPSRFTMYHHIKKAHQIDFKFPKKVKAGNSGRYRKCTKKIARKKSEFLKAKNQDDI